MSLTVGIKYCGNCNPDISTKEMLEKIKDFAVQECVSLKFVSWDYPEIQKLLILSGCTADCASRPKTDVPEVVVAGETVNRCNCHREHIPSKVIALLLSKD